jgi:hypothetical protein
MVYSLIAENAALKRGGSVAPGSTTITKKQAVKRTSGGVKIIARIT